MENDKNLYVERFNIGEKKQTLKFQLCTYTSDTRIDTKHEFRERRNNYACAPQIRLGANGSIRKCIIVNKRRIFYRSIRPQTAKISKAQAIPPKFRRQNPYNMSRGTIIYHMVNDADDTRLARSSASRT